MKTLCMGIGFYFLRFFVLSVRKDVRLPQLNLPGSVGQKFYSSIYHIFLFSIGQARLELAASPLWADYSAIELLTLYTLGETWTRKFTGLNRTCLANSTTRALPIIRLELILKNLKRILSPPRLPFRQMGLYQ